ncbi:hypothetical protein [Aquimarina megaterium]|uniref:hypothetical protein n=1 Tax=Aquimarina megaterium TaxID=1443666 RepID=UPI000470C479|nr:hypothetical protein [Aquimarina megaterium]
MGSSGSGNFSDYPGSKPTGGGKSGGSSGENKCEKAFTAMLEEIDRCPYYIEKKDVPKVGDEVKIGFDKRPTAISKDGLTVGYLPTKFNYIKMCLDDGYSFIGRVASSSSDLVAAVSIDVIPSN